VKIFLNGRFLSQSLTGVQRYAVEMVRAIDGLLVSGEAAAALRQAEWELLTPPDASSTIALACIRLRKVGRRTGHAWDQIDLAGAARRGRLISLANTGPVLHPGHLVVIHDAQVFRRPDFFSFAYGTAHRALGHLLARRATIATVSDFSRRELAAVLRLRPTAIPVFPNSAEHFAATVPDFGVIKRLRLTPGRFFLTVGSMNKNKNIDLAVQAARKLKRPDFPLVVVGSDNPRIFGGGLATTPDGVAMVGRLTDEEIAALYARATAFVFPSLYEGFGVPPLEAMIFACPVIASTAPAVRESCGDAPAYFNPLEVDELCARMRERIAAGGISPDESRRQKARLAGFSWRRSAAAMLDFLAGRERQGGALPGRP
jgi:glycosyltransferase involved in cell wall biosynthesis